VDEDILNLSSEIRQKREKFISLVADKFSMSLVLEELDQPTAESVMLQRRIVSIAKRVIKRLMC